MSGVEIRENLLTGRKFTDLLKTVSRGESFDFLEYLEGKILTFYLSRSRENGFPALKRESNVSRKKHQNVTKSF